MITPVSSRIFSGNNQRSGKCVPFDVVLYLLCSGIPASRIASKPAPIAKTVTASRAEIRSSGKPKSSTISFWLLFPASLITSARSSMVSKRGPPASDLTRRVIFFSAISWRNLFTIGLINCSPRNILARFSSSNTFSVPGRPRAAPVIQTSSTCWAGCFPE